MNKKSVNDKHIISRRDFLKTAAAGAVGVASAGLLGACNSSSDESSITGTDSPTTAAPANTETTTGESTSAAAAQVPIVSSDET